MSLAYWRTVWIAFAHHLRTVRAGSEPQLVLGQIIGNGLFRPWCITKWDTSECSVSSATVGRMPASFFLKGVSRQAPNHLARLTCHYHPTPGRLCDEP